MALEGTARSPRPSPGTRSPTPASAPGDTGTLQATKPLRVLPTPRTRSSPRVSQVCPLGFCRQNLPPCASPSRHEQAACLPAPCPRGSGLRCSPTKGTDPSEKRRFPPTLNPPGTETSRAYHRVLSPPSEEECALARAGPAARPSPGQRMPADVTHLLLAGNGHLRL